MELKVTVIIPTYKRQTLAKACITSVLNCGIKELEIIVVNDDKEHEFVLENSSDSPNVRIVANTKKGVASARNTGAKLARSPILIFLDDDMLVNSDAINKAIAFVEKNENCAYNPDWKYPDRLLKQIYSKKFGRYLKQNNHTTLEGWNKGGTTWKHNDVFKVEGITSQFLAIRKSTLENVGFYNENFPFAGFEDFELSKRLMQQNVSVFIDTTTFVLHNESDRMNIGQWLERKKRGAITRKVAVEMGHTELTLNYTGIKLSVLKLLSVLKPLIHVWLFLIPNLTPFDRLYAKTVETLIAVNIFEGYHSK